MSKSPSYKPSLLGGKTRAIILSLGVLFATELTQQSCASSPNPAQLCQSDLDCDNTRKCIGNICVGGDITTETSQEKKTESISDSTSEKGSESNSENNQEKGPELISNEVAKEAMVDGGIEPGQEIVNEPTAEKEPVIDQFDGGGEPAAEKEPTTEAKAEIAPEIAAEPTKEATPEPVVDSWPTNGRKPGSPCTETAQCDISIKAYCNQGICSQANMTDYDCKTDDDCKNNKDLKHMASEVECHPGALTCRRKGF